MGRMKDLIHKLFNDKIGDYQTRTLSKPTDDGAFVQWNADKQDYVTVHPGTHITSTPYGRRGTVCLPSGTSVFDLDAIQKSIDQQNCPVEYTGPTYSDVAGSWVNSSGEKCQPNGEPLSTLDENGWRRE